jgi:hypothetical protein
VTSDRLTDEHVRRLVDPRTKMVKPVSVAAVVHSLAREVLESRAEIAAERALADRLAEALRREALSYGHELHQVPADALAAYDEARRED